MALMDEIMPTVASAGFTQTQIVNALRNNKSLLLSFLGSEDEISRESVLKIFEAIKESGSLKNCGGYLTLAIYAGCTYAQAKKITDEILAAVQYIELNNLWGE